MTPLCKHVDWIDYMTANCARTCDLCNTTTSINSSSCSDIASNCAANSRLCTDSIYRSLMLQQCCATCNTTSTTSSCSNIASNCAANSRLCVDSVYRSLMLQQCCATCSGTSTSSISSSISCFDTSSSCSTWARNGFCSNRFYTTAQKRQFCARSCNLC